MDARGKTAGHGSLFQAVVVHGGEARLGEGLVLRDRGHGGYAERCARISLTIKGHLVPVVLSSLLLCTNHDHSSRALVNRDTCPA